MPLKVLKIVEWPALWTVKETSDGDFLFVREEEGRYQSARDASDLLELVLGSSTVEEVYQLLMQYGHPGINEMEYVGTQDFLFPTGPLTFRQHVQQNRSRIFLSEIKELQRLLRVAMMAPVEQWKFDVFDSREMNFQIEVEQGQLLGICRMYNGVQACMAVIYLEKLLQHVQYAWCTMCGRYFRRESLHHRKYCDETCARVAAVRAFRKRLAEKKRAIKTTVRA